MTARHPDVQNRRDHVGDDRVSVPRRVARAVVARAPFLVDAYRMARDPKLQLDLMRDERSWRRQTRHLRALPRPATDAPVVLAVSVSDQPFDVKSRVLVTSGLRRRGWRVVVLARNRRSPRLRRLYRAAGIHDFVFLDEVEVTPAARAAADQAVAGWLADERWTFSGVRSWSFGTSWIGPQVLSTVSRRLLEGAPDPAEPAVRAEIEWILPQTVETAQRAEAVVTTVRPSLAVLDEYNYTLAGPITDSLTASGVDVITARQMFQASALLPMRLNAASRRIHHASVARRTVDRLMATEWTPAHEAALQAEFATRFDTSAGGAVTEYQAAAARHAGRDEIVATVGLRGDAPIAVIFSHVLWDANLFYGEDLFDNFGDWLAQTVAAAAGNDKVDWVVKLHPANISKSRYHGSQRLNELEILDRTVGPLPDHVRVMMPDCPITTLSLYQHADVGLTVRGTPGLEMPCFGKPALTAGTGRFEGLGFTVDSSSREEYLDRLGRLHELGPLSAEETLRAKWHAYALFRLREWRLRSAAIVDGGTRGRRWHPLERNLVLDPGVEAADVDELAAWMLDTAAIDYVAADPLAGPVRV